LKPKVLFLCPPSHMQLIFDDETFNELTSLYDLYLTRSGEKEKQLEDALKYISSISALITGWGSPSLTSELLERAEKLRIIIHSAGSIKSILSKEIVESFLLPRKIIVCNAVKQIAYNVAETTIGMMIFAGRKFFDHVKMFGEKAVWRDPSLFSKLYTTINGSTIGIVGVGAVGREVIRLLKCFRDVTILVYDPYLKEEEADKLGVSKVSLEKLFQSSEIISIHAPLTSETEGMIGHDLLELLKPGAILINTAKGRIIDGEALVERCRKGDITVVLDVTDPEPPPPEYPLRRMPNVYITPHIAGCGHYGMKGIGRFVLRSLTHYFSGMPVEGEVNLNRYDIFA